MRSEERRHEVSAVQGDDTSAVSRRSNLLLAALPAIDRDRLMSYASDVDLLEGDVLHEARQPFEYVYFPHGGLVSLLVVLSDGAIAEAGFVGGEGAVGTNYNDETRVSFTRSVVIAGGRASRVPLARFDLLVEQSAALRRLVGQNNIRIMERAQQTAACNLLHRLEARVCRWLLQSLDGSGCPDVLITQDSLAHMLGVSRARLNETLKTLQEAKAIAQGQRGVLRIRDAALVSKHACSCFQEMKGFAVAE